MKKIVFLLLFFCFALSFSQENEKSRYFPAVYTLKNSNDTIKARVRNTGAINNKKYALYTIIMKMKMVDNEKNVTWVKPNDIRYIKITDPENVSYEYFASTDKLSKEVGLVKSIYEGRNISCYQGYSGTGFNVMGKEYVINKDKNIIFEGSLAEERFKSLFTKYPDLGEKLKSAKTLDDYKEVLKLADSKLD